jgi:hypothetical protein
MEKLEAKDDQSVIVTMTFRRPEHEQELMEALNASKYLRVIWEMDRWLRNGIKYGDDSVRAKHLQDARNHLYEALEDDGIVLE